MTEEATLPSGRRVTITDAQPPPDDPIWIAPREAAIGTGLGTREDPLRVAGPFEFDQVFRSRGGVGHFRLYPGEYLTQGSWAFPEQGYALTVGRSSLIGIHGPSATRIRLSDPIRETDGKPRDRRDLNIAWFGRAYGDDDFITIQGITFDAGEVPEGWTVSGPYLWGSHVTVRDIDVCGIHGDYAREVEVFVLALIGKRGGAHVRGLRSRGVLASSYVSGISIGYTGANVAPSLVEDFDLDGSGGNHFALAGCNGTVFAHGTFRGWKTAFYNDTGPAIGVMVIDVHGRTEYAAVRLIRNKDEPKALWRLLDCGFDYGSMAEAADGRPFPWVGIALSSTSDAVETDWENLSAERCRFGAPDRRPMALVSCIEPRTAPVVTLVDCTGPAHSQIHLPKATAAISMFRDASGRLMASLPEYR